MSPVELTRIHRVASLEDLLLCANLESLLRVGAQVNKARWESVLLYASLDGMLLVSTLGSVAHRSLDVLLLRVVLLLALTSSVVLHILMVVGWSLAAVHVAGRIHV